MARAAWRAVNLFGLLCLACAGDAFTTLDFIRMRCSTNSSVESITSFTGALYVSLTSQVLPPAQSAPEAMIRGSLSIQVSVVLQRGGSS
jgi:hypothetical protein